MKLKDLLIDFILISLAIIPFLIINNVMFLKDPPIWPDETAFFDMSQNFSRTGKIATSIYGNIAPGVENTNLGYPPLYFIAQNFWVKNFGSDIETLRLMSFSIALLSLVVFFFLTKSIFQNSTLAFFGTIFLSLDVHFARSSRLARMEIQTFFFITTALFTLHFAQKKNKYIFYFLSGILAALATLSHTIGFIAPLIIILTILSSQSTLPKKITQALSVTIPVLVFNLFWIATTNNTITTLITSYSVHVADKTSKLPYAFTLFNVDFSWRILFISYLVIFLIFLGLIKKLHSKSSSFFLIGIIGSALFVLTGKEGSYLIYLQPFITLIILNLLLFIKKEIALQNFGKVLLIILPIFVTVLSYLNIQIFNNDNLGMTNRSNRSVFGGSYNYHDFTKQILKTLPQDKQITIFLSATPDPYFDLRKLNNFKFFLATAPYVPISNFEYKKILDSSDYLILTWIPHQFLADYVNKNSDSIINVEQPNGYSAAVVKLKPKDDRI